jgi:excisionase family DNA binding protein
MPEGEGWRVSTQYKRQIRAALDRPRATMSVEEAASALGISRSLAYELARRAELPGVRRLGRRYVVSSEVLNRWLAGTA